MKKILIITLITFLMISCNSDLGTRPVVETNTENLSTEFVSATIFGKVIDNGQSTISRKGFCYDKYPDTNFGDLTYSDVTDDPNGFSAKIENLEPYTTYYIRAFATNEIGYGYGEETSFTTGDLNISPPCSPTINSFGFQGNVQNVTSKTISYPASFQGFRYETNTQVHIDFYEMPESGIYPTINSTLDSSLIDKCYVKIIYGDVFNGYIFHPEDNSLVYVKKTGENKYIITFCDFNFSSTQTALTFTSSGNLTYQ